MNFKLITAAALVLASVSMASAKGHDQGSTTVPGMDVGTETVSASQSLGSIKGNRPDDKTPVTPARTNAGR